MIVRSSALFVPPGHPLEEDVRATAEIVNPAYLEHERMVRSGVRSRRADKPPQYLQVWRLIPGGHRWAGGTLIPRCWSPPKLGRLIRQDVFEHYADTPLSGVATLADGFALRDYQQAAVDAFVDNECGVVVMPCGAGKTSTGVGVIQRLQRRTLILVHTVDLGRQWIERIAGTEEFDGQLDGVTVGTVGGGRKSTDEGADVVVATIQTLTKMPWRELYEWGKGFGLVILDECFVAGTLVGGVPIEQIKAGDTVPSYDEATGEFVSRRVVRTFKKWTETTVTVTTTDGSFTCTPCHRMLAQGGWTEAKDLRIGDRIRRRPVYDATYDDVQGVWAVDGEDVGEVLFDVQEGPTRREAEAGRLAVQGVRGQRGLRRSAGAGEGEDRRGLLLGRVQGRMGVEGREPAHGEDEPDPRQCTHEGKQPHEPARDPREGQPPTEGDRPPASVGRERPGPDGSAAVAGRRAGVADGGLGRDGDPAAGVQGRHRERSVEAGDRGRRPEPQRTEGPGSRRAEDGDPSWARVVRVEVQELRGADGPERVPVYDLEVEGTHTYLVDDGLVAHNCHHAPAETFLAVLNGMPARYRLGLTATPDREDGMGSLLWAAFGDVAHQVDRGELIARGAIRPARLVVHNTGSVVGTHEFKAGPKSKWIPVQAGEEYRQAKRAVDRARDEGAPWPKVKLRPWAAQVSELVADPERNEMIVELAAAKVDEGHSVIILSERVAHCRALAKALRERGVSAQAVAGSQKPAQVSAILAAARRREVRVLVGTTKADEGLDVPVLSCGILATRTKKFGRLTQRLGRIERPEGLAPEWHDLVDAFPSAQRAWKDRRKLYEALQLEGAAWKRGRRGAA